MEALRNRKCPRCNCYAFPDDFISKHREVTCCKNCRDRSSRTAKRWRAAHPEKVIENNKNWAENHPDYGREVKLKNKTDRPLITKLKNMILKSRQSDRISERSYETNDFIDLEFLTNLYDNQKGLCYYDDCSCNLALTFNHVKRDPTQIRI